MFNFIKKNFFYRQHPETALRYSPIVEIIMNKGWEKSKILEIGSGSYGIAPYLKRLIDGIDVEFDEPEYPLLKQIKLGKNWPFKEGEYEIVILSDVLEHIPKKDRAKTIKLAVEAASKAVIISGPFGEEAFEQDKELAEYSKKKIGEMHRFLEEHLEYGLPEVEEVVKNLKSYPKIRSVKIVGSFLNLNLRRFLMHFFITSNKLIFYFYLKGLMFFVPIFKKINNPPCYRKVILAEI